MTFKALFSRKKIIGKKNYLKHFNFIKNIKLNETIVCALQMTFHIAYNNIRNHLKRFFIILYSTVFLFAFALILEAQKSREPGKKQKPVGYDQYVPTFIILLCSCDRDSMGLYDV